MLSRLNTCLRNIIVSAFQKLLRTAGVAALLLTGISSTSFAQHDEVELTIEIIQRGSKITPAAWVHLQGAVDKNINGWYKSGELKGFPILSSTKVKVPPGLIKVTAWNSNCDEVSKQIVITKHQPAKCKLILTPRFDMHKRGYFSFDAHDHMDGDNEMNRPPFIYPYCAALGIDHLSVCQLWFHTLETPVSYDSIQTYLKAYSTPRLDLKFGVESPKLRYGHTWTVNHPGLNNPLGDYLSWHDVEYIKYQVSPDTIESVVKDLRERIHPTWQPPFVDRLRTKTKGAFNAAAHPTRWWHHPHNEVLPAANITADLAFDLIAAQSYDGLTVMGDVKDNINYQNLWFNILNLGYRLVPVAETDGNIANGSLGNLALTHVWTGGTEFDFHQLTDHLKKGHTTLSGKAVMLLTVDGTLPPGSVLLADGKNHTINVEIYSEPASDEYISFLVLYRNGKVVQKIDLRKQKKRLVRHQFHVSENETAWYVVKSYGKVYPKEEVQFDVLAYAQQSLQDGNSDYTHNTGVSFSAPVYFDEMGWTAPKPIISNIFGRILDKDAQPLKNTRVEIWNIDEKLSEIITDDKGDFQISAPATIDVRFRLPDGRFEQQWLFYEYPPLLDLLEDTYTISWSKQYPNIRPGQIPWEAFHYNEMLTVLSEIHWTIKPNGKIMLPGTP